MRMSSFLSIVNTKNHCGIKKDFKRSAGDLFNGDVTACLWIALSYKYLKTWKSHDSCISDQKAEQRQLTDFNSWSQDFMNDF